MKAESEGERFKVLEEWVASTNIKDRIQFRLEDPKEQDHLYGIIVQFAQNNFMFCKSNKFTEEKMTIVMELLHYLMRQLVDQGENLSEDQSYENFKQLLLRHAVHRPPHSLSILNLDEVKKIDLFA